MLRYVLICWGRNLVTSDIVFVSFFSVLSLPKLTMLMNMAEYGFSFRHKLSLAICIICKYLDSRLHFNILPLTHYLFLPILFSIEYASSMASSMTSNLNIHLPTKNTSKSLVSHLPSDHLHFPKAPNSTEAARRYRRLVQPSASADSTASHKDVRKGNLSEIQVQLLEDVVASYAVSPI